MNVDQIPDLKRIESFSVEQFRDEMVELTHSVYPHDEMFSRFITVEEYIDCPPEAVFNYMSRSDSLNEWTYSVRGLKPTAHDPELFEGMDQVGKNTKIFCKTLTNRTAGTVDYHCAWDQGDKLWMVYLNRIIPAEPVLNKPGSVVLWTNCRHPYYDKNPFPELARDRKIWVGDMWDYFYAGHQAEMQNLKKILEYRHRHGDLK